MGCLQQNKAQEGARSFPAHGTRCPRLSRLGPSSPMAVTAGHGVAASWGWPRGVTLDAPEADGSPGEEWQQEGC